MRMTPTHAVASIWFIVTRWGKLPQRRAAVGRFGCRWSRHGGHGRVGHTRACPRGRDRVRRRVLAAAWVGLVTAGGTVRGRRGPGAGCLHYHVLVLPPLPLPVPIPTSRIQAIPRRGLAISPPASAPVSASAAPARRRIQVVVFGPERIIEHGRRGQDSRAPPTPGAHGALEVLGSRHSSTPHTSALMRRHSRKCRKTGRRGRVAGARARVQVQVHKC